MFSTSFFLWLICLCQFNFGRKFNINTILSPSFDVWLVFVNVNFTRLIKFSFFKFLDLHSLKKFQCLQRREIKNNKYNSHSRNSNDNTRQNIVKIHWIDLRNALFHFKYFNFGLSFNFAHWLSLLSFVWLS